MSQLATSSSKYLLHHIDEDGAEYFTVISTGQSGMSQSGLARFVGVSSVSYLTNKIRTANPTINNLPECLKPFAGKNLTLKGYFDAGGRHILEDRFCAAVVEYYARWSKSNSEQSKVKSEQALKLIQHLGMKFMQERAGEVIQNIGMRRFIHNKTGWQQPDNNHVPDNFEQEFAAHNKRLTVRESLKHELGPELKSAIEEWRKANRASQKIYSDTYDAMNLVLQGLKSREIKQNNKLSKSASIRDHFETRPLIDYIGLTRLAANFIHDRNMDPVKAVRLAGDLFLPSSYVPAPVPIVENVYKADRRLQTEKKNRELAAGKQLSLPGI